MIPASLDQILRRYAKKDYMSATAEIGEWLTRHDHDLRARVNDAERALAQQTENNEWLTGHGHDLRTKLHDAESNYRRQLADIQKVNSDRIRALETECRDHQDTIESLQPPPTDTQTSSPAKTRSSLARNNCSPSSSSSSAICKPTTEASSVSLKYYKPGSTMPARITTKSCASATKLTHAFVIRIG